MATVNFYLKNPNAAGALKKEEVSIYAKFTLSRKERFEVYTDEKILPKHWDFNAKQAKSSAPDHITINLYLSDFRKNLITLWRENRGKSFSEFKALAQGVILSDEKKSLSSALQRFLKQYEQDKDVKTWRKYKALSVHLQTFQTLDFGGLDWSFIDSFRSTLCGKGLQDSSVYKYIANLKTFLTWAQKRAYPVNPIYKDWEVVTRVKSPLTLTRAELEKLESAMNLTREESIGRDFLCLESRTGQRISDLVRFDIKDYLDYKWTFFRKKGNSIKAKRVTVRFTGFCAPALFILAKHNFKMPEVSEQSINRWIKDACKAVGMTQTIIVEKWVGGKCVVEHVEKWTKMSTHVGRKTFITLALHAMPPKLVMELAGIDGYQTLKHYDGAVEDAIIEQGLSDMQAKLKVV